MRWVCVLSPWILWAQSTLQKYFTPCVTLRSCSQSLKLLSRSVIPGFSLERPNSFFRKQNPGVFLGFVWSRGCSLWVLWFRLHRVSFPPRPFPSLHVFLQCCSRKLGTHHGDRLSGLAVYLLGAVCCEKRLLIEQHRPCFILGILNMKSPTQISNYLLRPQRCLMGPKGDLHQGLCSTDTASVALSSVGKAFLCKNFYGLERSVRSII